MLKKVSALAMTLIFATTLWSAKGLAGEDKKYIKDVKERTLALPKCDKPIGRVLVKSFDCKAAQCADRGVIIAGTVVKLQSGHIGDGLADMLTTALMKTGCFEVVDRTVLEDIKQELALMGKKIEEVRKPADYIITGAITAVETKEGSASGGGLVIPLFFDRKSGALAGIKLGKDKMHLGLDIRVVRVADATILLAKSVEGKSENWNFGLVAGGLFGTTPIFGGGGASSKTPLEEAARDLIANAVTLITTELAKERPDVKVEMVELKEEKKKGGDTGAEQDQQQDIVN